MVPELTEERHYDTATGDYDGQLVHADLVDQLPPPIPPPIHPLPDLDNTVKTLFYWAMDLDIPHGPRLALLTILRHIDWGKGDHCTAGIKTLARESQFSTKTLKEHIRFLVDAKLINRLRHVGRITETRLGTVGVETSPMAGVETSPIVGVAATPETNSSSTDLINQLDTGVADAKSGTTSPLVVVQETGVTTGAENTSFEEEKTGTGPKDYQEWVDRNLSEIPTDSEIEQLGKHCWPEWKKHWGGGWAAAWPTWTKDIAGRKKFRSDVVAQLAKVGLPKPMTPDPDNDRAKERAAAWLDQRLEEAPALNMDKKCAGCGHKRQLPPGETHCQPCRKALVEVAA